MTKPRDNGHPALRRPEAPVRNFDRAMADPVGWGHDRGWNSDVPVPDAGRELGKSGAVRVLWKDGKPVYGGER